MRCVLVERRDSLEILSHLLEQPSEPEVFLTEIVGQGVGCHLRDSTRTPTVAMRTKRGTSTFRL